MHIGNALKYYRNLKNLTLDDLAKSLNETLPEDKNTIFNKGKLSIWENNKEEPKLSELKYVAEFYGITIDDIITLSKNEVEIKQANTYDKLKESLEALGLYVHTIENGLGNEIAILSDDNMVSMNYNAFTSDPVHTFYYAVNALLEQDTIKIPLVGEITSNYPVLSEENIEDYFYLDSRINADFILKVKGDSMINVCISDGDYALIQKQSTLENGEIGAVVIDNKVTLKRFYKQEDVVILQTENPHIDGWPKTFKDENIVILGKLIGVYSDRA